MSLLVVGHSFARRLRDANAKDVFRRKMSVTFSNVTMKGKGRLKVSRLVAILAAAHDATFANATVKGKGGMKETC